MTHRTEKASNESYTNAILRAIAAVDGRPMLEIEPPLYERVDPCALERVLESGATSIEFDYEEFSITVDRDGEICLRNQE